jgi:hypothetical protein
MIKGNENQGNVITDATVEEIDIIIRNNPYPAWMNRSCSSNLQKPYPNPTGAPNTYNGGNNSGSRQSLEDSLKTCMQAQNKHTNLVIKITENHETAIGQLSKQVVVTKKSYT